MTWESRHVTIERQEESGREHREIVPAITEAPVVSQALYWEIQGISNPSSCNFSHRQCRCPASILMILRPCLAFGCPVFVGCQEFVVAWTRWVCRAAYNSKKTVIQRSLRIFTEQRRTALCRRHGQRSLYQAYVSPAMRIPYVQAPPPPPPPPSRRRRMCSRSCPSTFLDDLKKKPNPHLLKQSPAGHVLTP